MFRRMWKNHDDSEESYDDDTLPIIRKHQNNSQIKAQSLSLVVNMLVKKKEKAKGKWLPMSHKVQQYRALVNLLCRVHSWMKKIRLLSGTYEV